MSVSATIVGIGTALPSHRIDRADAEVFTQGFCCETDEQRRTLSALFRRSGISSRRSVLLASSEGDLALRQNFYGATSPTTAERMTAYEEHAWPLAVSAATSAIDEGAIGPDCLTHLVTVSCSGFSAPGFDQKLIRTMNLPLGIARTHLGFMGCHAMLNGLRVARAFAGSDPSACILLVAVELCSLHYQYGWHPERVVANALFSDGAAAMVVRPSTEVPRPGHSRILADGSMLIPECAEAMSWRIADHGFTMTLSPEVPDRIAEHVRPWLVNWLGRHGRSIESIGSWAVHPGGPRILSAFAEAVGLDRDKLDASSAILAECGNMSSPTIAFIIRRLRDAGAPRPCLAIGFGPGLAIEAVLLD